MSLQTVGARAVLENVRGYMSDVDKVTNHTNKSFGSTTKSISGMGGAAQKFGPAVAAGAGAGTIAILGLGAASIATAQGFEKALDSVAAVSQATNTEMKELHDTALRIGKDTAFGATETAKAMELLAANGLTARQIIDGAADATVNLAAAGGTDLALAADTASTAMTVWGLKTKDLNELVNRLAGAANVSRFGVEDMSMAIAQGGGAAAAFGVEIGDFLTTVAAIAPSFQSGSDAGTSLKTMFTRLTPGSAEARTAMEELGIITEETGNRFFDAQGNMKSMAEVAQILHDTTSGLSEEQRIQALSTIFGSDAMRAAAAISQQTGDSFAAMDAKMAGTDASKIAKQRMDNFAGSMEQLKGSLEVLAIVIGEKLIPVTRKIVDFITKMVNVFTNLPGPVQNGIIIVAALTAGLLALVAVFTTMSLAILAMSAAAGVLSISLLPIIAIVGAVVIAIIALAVIAYLIYKNWGAIKEFFSDLWNNVKEIFNAAVGLIVGAVKKMFNAVIGFLTDHWREIAGILGGPFIFFATDAFGIRTKIVNLVKGIFRAVTNFITKNWREIAGLLGGPFVMFATDGFGIRTKTIKMLKGLFSAVTKLIKDFASSVINLIRGFVSSIIKLFKDLATGVLAAVSGLVRGVIRFWTDLATGAVNLVKGMATSIVGVFTSLPGQIAGALSSVFNSVTGTFANIASDVLGTIGGMMTAVVGFFTGLPGRIVAALGDVAGQMGAIGSSIMQALLDGISGAFGGALSLANTIANAVIDSINSILSVLGTAVEWLKEALDKIPGPNPAGNMLQELANYLKGSPIPHLATGTASFAGGIAVLGELGPELALLPQGTAVLSAAHTSGVLDMMASAPAQAVTVNMPVNVQVSGGLDWARIREAIHQEIDVSLNTNRVSTINAGVSLGSGVG